MLKANLEDSKFTETTEAVDWFGDVARQGVVSFEDDLQVSDFSDFIDEIIGSVKGLGGFFKNAKGEAKTATIEEVDGLFQRQIEKLISAGVHPMAAATIVGGLKTSYTGFCWAIQTRDEKKA